MDGLSAGGYSYVGTDVSWIGRSKVSDTEFNVWDVDCP
jgi:hypothetical protein